MASILLLFIVSFNILGTYVHCELTTAVQTDKGPVQGEILKSFRKSTEFSSFRGIRYGKPPVGYSRFKAPEEAEPWTETFQATSEAPPCPQIDFVNFGNYIGNEDCLNLNVYTPKTNFSANHDNLLAVMVWINGGSFQSGYTNMSFYGPDFLIENGVVIVAMNYRLGPLGFLSLNHPNASGNAGLKDQLLALKWVQRNIKVFGGDPNNVTIFGQDTGGVSVDYHVLSDASKGLFHRSISMSASPLIFWGFFTSSEANSRAFHLGFQLGIETYDTQELLGELYKRSPEALIRATTKVYPGDAPFKPTLKDTEVAGDTAFLTECSMKKYKSGNFSHLPHITGFMANELLLSLTDLDSLRDPVNAGLDSIRKANSDTFEKLIPYFANISRQVPNTLDDLSIDVIKRILEVETDMFYISAIDTKQRLLANYGSAPVYYYRNSFTSNVSLHRLINGVHLLDGAAHGDDLAYCWHITVVNLPTDPHDPFVNMQDQISKMWTNFAKYSNPTPHGLNDSVLNINWPVSGRAGTHLEINSNLSVGERPIDGNVKAIQEILNPILEKLNDCSE